MSKIEDIADTEFDEVLEQVQSGECDIVDSHIDERRDMLEELLVVVLAAPCNESMGVVVVLIDHVYHLFAYPNISLIRTNF